MIAQATLWYNLIHVLTREGFFRLMGGLTILGREDVPMDGPVIFAPIHVSYLDPPLVGCCTPRVTSFMAKQELFKGIVGWFIKSLKSFPVKRGENDSAAIRAALEILKKNEALLIFPEGTRGDGVTLQAIKPGLAILAKRSGAAVVPVGISGTQGLLSLSGGKLKRTQKTVVFGEPLYYAEFDGAGSERESRDLFVKELGRRIAVATRRAGLPIKNADSNESQTSAPHP